MKYGIGFPTFFMSMITKVKHYYSFMNLRINSVACGFQNRRPRSSVLHSNSYWGLPVWSHLSQIWLHFCIHSVHCPQPPCPPHLLQLHDRHFGRLRQKECGQLLGSNYQQLESCYEKKNQSIKTDCCVDIARVAFSERSDGR